MEDESWEPLFIKTEQHSYFDGQIGFILKYSKKDDSDYDKTLFEDYSIKLAKLFSSELRENHNFLFQRALLTKGDYLPQVGDSDNYTFGVFEEALRTKLDNWRKVFNDEVKTLLLKELLDDINKDDIQNELVKIINNHTASDWRKLIIEQPDNIAYCQYREIRTYSDDKIYLLSKKQMNGRHKEIFSWDLFERTFKQKEFLPFSNKPWYWESTSWDKPCIVLESFNYKENIFEIDISYEKENEYTLEFYDLNDVEIPNNIDKLLNELDFDENTISLPENEIEKKIKEICSNLENIEDE